MRVQGISSSRLQHESQNPKKKQKHRNQAKYGQGWVGLELGISASGIRGRR